MPKRAYWFLSILMAAVVLTAYGTDWTILRRLETLSRETRFRWRGPLPAGPEIAVAAIDEKSIDELGRWPWPRLVIANLIDKLVENEAAVIGLDIVFSSPEESSSLKDFTAIRSRLENSGVKAPALKDELDRKIKNADRDARLAQSFRNAGNVVMGYFFHHNPNAVKHLSTVARKAGLQTILKSRFAGFIKSGNDLDLQSIPFRSAWAVESNIPILSSAAGSHGFISFDAGSDGSIRAFRLRFA